MLVSLILPGKGKSVNDEKITRHTKAARAGLQFPVSRLQRYLKKGRYAKIIFSNSAVYMAAVIEYLVAEFLEIAGNAAKDLKRSRITPRHVQLAVGNDDELRQVFQGVTISQGGVIPHLHQALLVVRKKGGKKKRLSQGTTTTSGSGGTGAFLGEESGPA